MRRTSQNQHLDMSLYNTLVATAVLALAAAGSVLCDPHPLAEHVCNTTIPFKKDIVIEQPVQYEIKVQSMCGLLPCTKTRTETRTDQSIKTIIQHTERSVCCPGYTETPERKCAPICIQSCNNGGKCVAPNRCGCQPEPSDTSPGFAGPTCSRFVCFDESKWGSKCERSCACSGNSYCAANTGKCLCYPGWRGINCTLECDTFSNDDECQESNRLPPIIEPESNLMSANLVLERQRPEALVLDDDVRIVAEDGRNDWQTLTAGSLIGVLSVVSLIFIVAFLVIKRRYERIRNELYYSASSNYSEPPPYESASQSPSEITVVPSNSGNLGKNFSFATTTRNILLCKDVSSLHDKKEQRDTLSTKLPVESHLVWSKKQAKQNVYTEITQSMLKTVDGFQRPLSPPTYTQAHEENIYQVPKSLSVGTRADTSELSADDSDITSNGLGQTHEDDSTSNIYEEIKPRK